MGADRELKQKILRRRAVFVQASLTAIVGCGGPPGGEPSRRVPHHRTCRSLRAVTPMNPRTGGQVIRILKAGGDIELLADEQAGPTHIVDDEGCVYWTNTGEGLPSIGSVMRAPKGLP